MQFLYCEICFCVNSLYKLKCRQVVDIALIQYDSYTTIRLLLNCFKYIPNNGMWDDQNWIPTCFMASSNISHTKVFALAFWHLPPSQPSKPVNRTPSIWLSRALHKSTRGCGQMLSKVCHRWELKISQIRAAAKCCSHLLHVWESQPYPLPLQVVIS